MKTSLDCLPCLLRAALDAARMASPDPLVHRETMSELLRWMSEMDVEASPPVLAQRIHRRLRELTGVNDPYRKAKDEQNRMAWHFLHHLKDEVEKTADPLAMTVGLAIAANIIDLGAKTGLTNDEILPALTLAIREPVLGDMEGFRRAVATDGHSILYLADNAGEIVFDRLLIEQLKPRRVTLAVRGRPVINDATMDDARAAELDELVEIIDNGSDAPGTVLADCSPEFIRRFDQADLIIAKGQGNFETLSDDPHNIFFLFKIKCPVIAHHIGLPVGTHVLARAGSGILKRGGQTGGGS